MSSPVVAFRIEDDEWVPEVLRQLTQAFSARRRDELEVHATWYDTFDRRLATAGVALAVRAERPGQTLTLHVGKRSIECRGAAKVDPDFAGGLPAPIRHEVAPLIEMRRLLPEAEVSRKCLPIDVLDEEEKTVVRLVVEVRATRHPANRNGTGWTPLPAKLVVTGLKGYDRELATVLRFAETALGLEKVDASEYDEAGAALRREAAPPARSTPIDLARGMRAPLACKQVLRAQLRILQANQDGVWDDLDTEFLHDFRIAIRRTRTVLAQVPEVFPRPFVDHYKREFHWLGVATGPVRDIDAFELQVARYEEPFEGAVREDLAELWTSVRNQREQERQVMLKELESPRYANLVRNWQTFLDGDDEGTSAGLRNAKRPIEEVVARRIHRRFRKIVKARKSAGEDAPAERLHDLRIQGKRLRYLLELFGGLFRRRDVRAVVKELKRLQDTLGTFHDLDVHAAMIERIASERNGEVSARALMAAGRLVSHMETAAKEERRRFAQRIDRFASDENKKRFHRLLEGSRK